MSSEKTAFFAYPGQPREIAQTIVAAIEKHNDSDPAASLEPWEANDISGVPLTRPIFEKIGDGLYVAADITFLNDNVIFEVGYAIGQKKRCLIFRSSAIEGDKELTTRVGIFDTLGYEEYANSNELSAKLAERDNFDPLAVSQELNRRAPVYIVEPPKRNEPFGILISRVKKARWMYRSFNPSEEVRLSAMDAIRHVSQSAGVIVTLLSDGAVAQREHNLRAMFVAGLSMGLGIPTLVLHSIEYIPPLDIRDLTKKFSRPDDIRRHVQDFSLEITEYIQKEEDVVETPVGLLTSLRIGDPTAENEMTTLSQYYLATDEYARALRGDVNLVVGRKGSGKTALFVQLRNTKRRNRQNIVVDLKPEGYQLIKLKERVLDYLAAGVQQHLVTAFWEYLLLLEIAYKVLEKDETRHLHDHTITALYRELREIYGGEELTGGGDFSERLLSLSNALVDKYDALGKERDLRSEQNKRVDLSQAEITEILYKHDIRALSDCLCRYLRNKGEVWLLFDNIDKGWSVEGVSDTDIFVLRCLIDASRKLERELRKRDIEFHSVVFIRDDVYTLLMAGSADYGKEMRASLDWSDKDLLSQLLLKRIAASLGQEHGEEIQKLWSKIAVSHYAGDATLDHMIERSLMRPRNLIKILRYSLGYAINFGHERIEVEDIAKGLEAYSQDVITEVDRELTDVFPAASHLIYEFSEENSEFSHDDLITLIQCAGLDEEQSEQVISFLLYYGILGVKKAAEQPLYIFDVDYNIQLLKVRIRKWGGATKYIVNPALWPSLRVESHDQPVLV